MNICAVTMVRDDLFYIKKWISYYGSQIGFENLYVLVHGNAQQIRQLDHRVNFLNVPVRQDDTIGKERFNVDRFNLINGVANSLQAYFEHVIVTDADEYLVPDPEFAASIPEYISKYEHNGTLSAIGLDVYQHIILQPNVIDLKRPILGQRPICKVEPLYHKPAITNRVIRRALGNHYSNDGTLRFAKGLFLFHLKYFDRTFALGSQLNRDRLRANKSFDLTEFPEDNGDDFKYRDSIMERFVQISQLPISERFDFEAEISQYRRTWRRRRFFLHREFWKSLMRGTVSEYSFHWRFDLIRYDRLHYVPNRFWSLL